MGISTTPPTHTERLARIGSRLEAQRVELFAIVDNRSASLVHHWAALGFAEFEPSDVASDVALEWFPWSLGNVRPAEYMFVRNAGSLPSSTDGSSIAQLGMSSVLHLPLTFGSNWLGALCVYWSDERSSWPLEDREWICAAALEDLSIRR